MRIGKRALLVDPRSVWNEYLDPRLQDGGQPSAVDILAEKITKCYNERLRRAIVGNEARWNLVFRDEDRHALSPSYISTYGLLLLGTELTRRGFDCAYVNADYHSDDSSFFDACLRAADTADVICLTSTTPQYSEVLQLAKALGPHRRLVLGGPHAVDAEQIARESVFDAIIRGYDIVASADVIEKVAAEGPVPAGTPKRSRCFRCDGYVHVPKLFGLIPPDKLRQTLLYTYASTGCPNRCSYCSEHRIERSVSCLPAEACRDEMLYLTREAGLRLVHFADNDFLLNEGHARRILDMIEENGIRASFSINTSPMSVMRKGTADLLARFVDLGLVELLVGVECFSESVLALNCKPYGVSGFFDAFSAVRKAVDIPVVTFFSMVGLPGETEKTIRENLAWWERFAGEGLFDFSLPKLFVPYPGSEVYENPEAFGVKILSRDWSSYLRRSPIRPVRVVGMSDEMFTKEQLAILSLNRR